MRIDRGIVDADFVVKVRAGAASGVAHVADGVPAMNVLTGEHGKTLQVPVASGDSVAVVKHNRASISAHEIRKYDHTVSWRDDRLRRSRLQYQSLNGTRLHH